MHWKALFEIFFIIFSQRRELSPTSTLKWPRRNRAQITCNTSSAYHAQHVVLRATWYEGTAQLLSLTELKLHLFELYLVGWIIKPMVTLHDTRFVECRWWNDGWTVKTVIIWRSSASMIPAPDHLHLRALPPFPFFLIQCCLLVWLLAVAP